MRVATHCTCDSHKPFAVNNKIFSPSPHGATFESLARRATMAKIELRRNSASPRQELAERGGAFGNAVSEELLSLARLPPRLSSRTRTTRLRDGYGTLSTLFASFFSLFCSPRYSASEVSPRLAFQSSVNGPDYLESPVHARPLTGLRPFSQHRGLTGLWPFPQRSGLFARLLSKSGAKIR